MQIVVRQSRVAVNTASGSGQPRKKIRQTLLSFGSKYMGKMTFVGWPKTTK